jgi:hypothetical protein
VGAEPAEDGLVRDCRSILSRRASGKRPVNALGSTDDPAADRQQQCHPGDRQGRRPMIGGLTKRAPEPRQILGAQIDTAAQEYPRLIRRQMQVQDDGRAGSHELQHFRARHGMDQRK